MISSTSGTVAAPCTVLRWMKSGPFSASSCHGQRTFHSVGKLSVHSSVKYSSSWGTSQSGTCSGSGWYQKRTKPLRSMVGYVRTRAFLFRRSL